MDSDDSFDLDLAIRKNRLNKAVTGQHTLETGSFHFYENEPHESYLVGATVLLVLDIFRAYCTAIFKSTVFFLVERCNYSQLSAIMWFHLLTCLIWFVPCLTIVIADRYIGKYLMIIIGAIIYTTGYSLAAFASTLKALWKIKLVYWIGMILRSIGRGTVYPSYAAFGEEQLRRTDITKYYTNFIGLSFMVFSGCFVVSIIVSPIIRSEVSCNDKNDCYEGVYASGALCQLIFVLMFIAARPFYNVKVTKGSLILGVAHCMKYAYFKRKMVLQDPDYIPRGHWLDYAVDKYGQNFITDLKGALRVLKVFIPAPLVYCVYVQHESVWLFQVTRLDCQVGNYLIKPEQMLAFHIIFSLIFVPLVHFLIYPILRRFYIGKPLARIAAGILFILIAYVLAANLEQKLLKTFEPFVREGKGQLRIFSGVDCDYLLEGLPNGKTAFLKALDFFEDKNIDVKEKDSYKIKATLIQKSGPGCPGLKTTQILPIDVLESTAMSYFFTGNKVMKYEDCMKRSENGYPKIRVLCDHDLKYEVEFKHQTRGWLYKFPCNKICVVIPSTYDIYVNNKLIKSEVQLRLGGSYVLTIPRPTNETLNVPTSMGVNAYIPPNSIHVMNQIPQIMTLALGEIFFSTAIIEFIQAESPQSMKTVMWVSGFVLMGFGHFLFAVTIKFYYNPIVQYYVYTAILGVAFLIFFYSIQKYKYTSPDYYNIH